MHTQYYSEELYPFLLIKKKKEKTKDENNVKKCMMLKIEHCINDTLRRYAVLVVYSRLRKLSQLNWPEYKLTNQSTSKLLSISTLRIPQRKRLSQTLRRRGKKRKTNGIGWDGNG